MPYNAAEDPFATMGNSPTVYGNFSRVFPHSESTNPIVPYPKAWEVMVSGTLKVLPYKNDDGQWVDYGTVAPGFSRPLRIRRISADSTAVVWTIEDK